MKEQIAKEICLSDEVCTKEHCDTRSFCEDWKGALPAADWHLAEQRKLLEEIQVYAIKQEEVGFGITKFIDKKLKELDQ